MEELLAQLDLDEARDWEAHVQEEQGVELGFRDEGSGLRAQGVGFRAWGSGL